MDENFEANHSAGTFCYPRAPRMVDEFEFSPAHSGSGWIRFAGSLRSDFRGHGHDVILLQSGARMGKESGEIWKAVFGRAADLSVCCRLRTGWKTAERGNGQRAAVLATGHANFRIRPRTRTRSRRWSTIGRERDR